MRMFSTESRCVYRENPLAEVICQLRFPEILTIGTTIPDQFQEAIRAEFPRFERRQDQLPPKITGVPGHLSLENPQPTVNYQFLSADGIWRVNLTSKFISLSCSKYTRWEQFAQKLDKPLAAFIKLYQPAYFERVGLRYVNFISRYNLGLEGTPFRELMEPCYLGILSEEDVQEGSASRSSVDADIAIRGGCRAKIHAGPGMVKRAGQADKEIKFVFDLDLYMAGQVPVNLSAGALQTLHAQSYPIFRGAITGKLHEAMEPEIN